MSVVFNLSDFPSETQIKIDKMLTFAPIATKQFNNRQFTPTETPVKCYYTADKKVYLPYRFACSLTNKMHNMGEYPKLSEEKSLPFDGKLLPRQEEPYKTALEYLYRYNTCTIALYPGFGKTFLGCMLTHKLNLITCVLVHRENIGKQWIKSFKAYIPKLKESDLWYVDDKPNLTMYGWKNG